MAMPFRRNPLARIVRGTWDTPSPSPRIFALVAGDLREIRDQYTTSSGRQVTLRLHVEEGMNRSQPTPWLR